MMFVALRRFTLPAISAALLTACAEAPPSESLSAAEQSAQIADAATALNRYCLDGLPDLEVVAIAMSADSGPETGRAYTPYVGPEGFIGASLRAADGFSANASRQQDGRITCGVALFTPQQDQFETAVLDQVIIENELYALGPQPSAAGETTYALAGYPIPATLSFRRRANDDGDAVIGAVITIEGDGGPLPPSEPAAPADVAMAGSDAAAPPNIAPDPSSAPAQPSPAARPAPSSATEPASVADLSMAETSRAPLVAATAEPAAPLQPVAAPAEPRPSRPAPTMPRHQNPPSLAAAPELYEGASLSAFTPAQIAEFCKQDWRTRRAPGGRTEYNPCFRRDAFR